MKIVILTAFSLILFTDARATDDAKSQEDSYMPVKYKVQQLAQESMVATKPANRKARAAKEAADDCSDSECQSSVVTYTRWGNSTCPPGANIIYSGAVAGSWYDYYGSAAEPLCLPQDPQYLLYQDGYQGYVRLYGAEYRLHSSSPINQADDRNVPCALCEVVGNSNKIMIPSRYECPSGWRREYYGYLMAGYYAYKSATQYTCMDESLEQIPGSAALNYGYLFYTVEAYCDHFIPCSDKELTCVVCTK